MKIAYITDVVYPFVKGGAEKRIFEMGRRLAAQHDVHVFGMKWWKGATDLEMDGMTLHGICKPSSLYAGDRRSIAQALRFASSLRPILSYDLDVIDCSQFPYVHCFPARAFSTLRGVPFVITWHEFWGDYWYKYLGRLGALGELTEKAAVKLADQIIAVSKSTQEKLAGLAKAVALVPNGADIKWIDSVAPSERSFDVLFVGRLIPEKNVDILMQAVPEGMTLGIVGAGPEQKSLTALSHELNVNATFISSLRYEELIGVIKAANALVLPSSREGFGIVALEALACGTPVITSSATNNAAQDLVDHGVNGFIVDPVPVAIKEALLRADKKKMSFAAKESAAHFDWNDLCKKLCAVYNSLT
jgi:glycosyltransferase involved in cell wall biosynthesis